MAERTRVAVNTLWATTSWTETSVPSPPRRIRSVERTTILENVWLHFLQEGKRVAAARRASCYALPTGDELFRSISRKDAVDFYTSQDKFPNYVPFIAKLIAEPPEGTAAIRVLDQLPIDLAERYANLDFLLRPPDEVEEAQLPSTHY